MKNPRLIDMTALTAGHWFVLEQAGNSPKGGAMWSCRCSCGVIAQVSGTDLRSGKSRQCKACCIGLLKRARITHGDSSTRLHNIWSLMRSRCADASDPIYGGRGISVCPEWDSFVAFRDWALAHGYQTSLSIDRMDNDLGYMPSNCRWATEQQQSVNRRFVLRAPSGRPWCEIAKEHGISVTLMHGRVHEGWSIAEAATRPKRGRPGHQKHP